MNRRSLLKRIGAAGVATAAAGIASARTTGDDGGVAVLRFPGARRDDVTVQDDCAVHCCSNCPDHCTNGCICVDPYC